MNSDLTPNQNVSNTDNPQNVQATPTANDALQFQVSAGTEVLNQNRPISVISTGQPVTLTNKAVNNSASVMLFVIIATAILLFTAGAVFRRMMRIPDSIDKTPDVKVNSPVAATTVKVSSKTKSKIPKGKKKPSRSKRHQT